MISYETYKLLHLIFITSFLTVLGFNAQTTTGTQGKSRKMIIGLISFLIFVAGMGLIARLGFKHSQPFPLWIKLKMLNWFVINLLTIGIFKTTKTKFKLMLVFIILIIGWSSIWIAINKPL